MSEEEPTEIPQPTEPRSTDWPKIIAAVVLSLGLLVVAAYAGYYYGTQQVQSVEKPAPAVSQPTPTPTPTSDPTSLSTPTIESETSNWEIYTSSEYGFSFKYPGGWFLRGGSPEEGGGIMLLNYDISTAPGRSYVPELDKGKFKIEIYIDKDYSDIAEWYNSEKDRKSGLTGEKVAHYAYKNIVVDSQPGVFFETEAIAGMRVGHAVFEIPANNFLILVYGMLDYSGSKEYFNQILATFEFLD